MDKKLSNILGESGLPDEMVNSLQEAFDAKVAEQRQDVEREIREDFARRYEHDKAQLIEAMDAMLSDVITKYESEKVSEIKSLKEAKSAANLAEKKAKTAFDSKLKEHVSASKKLISEKITESNNKLLSEKAKLREQAEKMAEDLAVVKDKILKEHANRLSKIDQFVIDRVKAELEEFHQDKKALVETRVKLVSENRQKIKEMQKTFVKESAKKLEKHIVETLKTEMSQLHEDLEKNRQNMFGRRIFEAVAAEYMTSYLAEGTEIRNLQKMLESKENKLSELSSKLDEAIAASEINKRKSTVMEGQVKRVKIMSELLSSLSGKKRSIMESMLETTKTENLKDAFNKLLPVVLNENSSSRKLTTSKKTLVEAKQNETRYSSVKTGDRVSRVEPTSTEMEGAADLTEVIRLAGIQNN